MSAAPKISEEWNKAHTENLAAQINASVLNTTSHLSLGFGSGNTTIIVGQMLLPEPPVKVNEDFHGWLLGQASALRERQLNFVDYDNLAEELEAMAARDRREMKERLKNLLLHLLKFKFQPNEKYRFNSWRSSIREAREQIADILDDSPGIFQGNRDEVIAITYARACDKMADESGLPLNAFPPDCPWSFEQIMRADFFALD